MLSGFRFGVHPERSAERNRGRSCPPSSGRHDLDESSSAQVPAFAAGPTPDDLAANANITAMSCWESSARTSPGSTAMQCSRPMPVAEMSLEKQLNCRRWSCPWKRDPVEERLLLLGLRRSSAPSLASSRSEDGRSSGDREVSVGLGIAESPPAGLWDCFLETLLPLESSKGLLAFLHASAAVFRLVSYRQARINSRRPAPPTTYLRALMTSSPVGKVELTASVSPTPLTAIASSKSLNFFSPPTSLITASISCR